MGRNCGYLALMAGIAGGAESVVIPEAEVEPEVIARDIQSAYDRGKAHALVVVAEGARNNAKRLAEHFAAHKGQLGYDLRVTTLGHVQRGGTPGAFDRLLATRLAAAAIDHLERGEHGQLMGLVRGEVRATPLARWSACRRCSTSACSSCRRCSRSDRPGSASGRSRCS